MEYSVLVKRIVNLRMDGIQAESHPAAIRQVELLAFHELLDQQRGHEVGLNADGSAITLRYIEDGDEANCFLVDEAGDEEFARSRWYGSDGQTKLEPGNLCGECLRPRHNDLSSIVCKILYALRKQRFFTHIC